MYVRWEGVGGGIFIPVLIILSYHHRIVRVDCGLATLSMVSSVEQ